MRLSLVATIGAVIVVALSQGACTNNKANAAAKAEARAQAKLAQAEDGELVCKTFDETASRLRKRKECRTKEEWEALSKAAGEYVKDLERAGSAQAGGQSLGP